MEISAQEYDDYKQAKQANEYWNERIAAFRDKVKRMAAEAGDDTLTVNGREVFTYRPIAQFAAKEFERKDPDLAAQYMRRVTTVKIDVDLIRTTNPSLYEEYQVRRLEDAK